jgi:hypothetical protein
MPKGQINPRGRRGKRHDLDLGRHRHPALHHVRGTSHAVVDLRSGLRRGPRIFLPAPERSFSRVCLRLRLPVKSLAAPDVCPPAPCIWLDGDDQNGAGLIPSPEYVASNSQRGAHLPLMPLTHLKKREKGSHACDNLDMRQSCGWLPDCRLVRR